MEPGSSRPTVASEMDGADGSSSSRPARTLSTMMGQAAGWQPTTLVPGAWAARSAAMPAMSPPPPTGTNTASKLAQLAAELHRDGALAADDLRIVVR